MLTSCTDEKQSNDDQAGAGGASGFAGTMSAGGAGTGALGASGTGLAGMAPIGGTAAGGAGGTGVAGTFGASGVGGAAGIGATGGTGGMVGASGTGGTVAPPDCSEDDIASNPNTLSVSVATAQQVVHKEIFGVLLEILGKNVNGGIYVGTNSSIPNTNGIRDDIIEGFKEAGVGAIQWPGGCAANGYDWQTNVNPPNTMGTDLFMDFCTWVDAEPFLVGRPRPEFAQSNRDWVEYVNDNPSHPDWYVKYFKIGNEVWGCGGDLGDNEAAYEPWYNASYDLLNAPINGKELFLVGATGGIWTVNPNTNNWLTTMLSPGHLADRVDGIEIHDYIYFPDSIPSVGMSEAQYYDVVYRANEGQIAPRVRDVKAILDQHDPGGGIKIMEDEWGDWLIEFSPSDTWLQQGTLMDAISAAEHLHVFMQHSDRVLMGGLAQSTNVIHSLFLTNSSGGGTDLVKTPTFYVFKMFVPHHTENGMWAPTTLSSEDIMGNGRRFPVLSSGATVNDAGEVSISLVNVDLTNTRAVTVTLDSPEAWYVVDSAEVITGQARDSYNDFGQTENVNIQPLDDTSYATCGRKLEVTLPSKSVVMLRLHPLKGVGAGTGGTGSAGAGAAGTGSAGTGSAGTGAATGGCPETATPPTGTCTPWGSSTEPELCTYGATQCVCQAGQQGATWVCATCSADPIASGDDCSVTGMVCGNCVCEQSWLAGGQRDWAFACGGP